MQQFYTHTTKTSRTKSMHQMGGLMTTVYNRQVFRIFDREKDKSQLGCWTWVRLLEEKITQSSALSPHTAQCVPNDRV